MVPGWTREVDAYPGLVRARVRHEKMAAAAVSTMDLERLVGIAEYVSPDAPGVGGIIKARPADFQVNELTTADCEVILEECEPPGAARIIAAVAVPAVQSAAADDDSEELMITRFTLRKERMDTLGAIAELARQLEVPSRSFGFAGLKDHRAVTTQELTVRGVPPAAVRTAEHSHFQVCVKSCRLVPRALRLGQHGGNRFRIVLRGVDGTAADIEAALGALRRRGFVNYYGLQRFGESAARNDEVGKHLLLGEYALAVDALLRPRPEDKPRGAEAEARDVWVRSNDCRTALKLMPRARFVEREILGSLCHSLCRGHLLSHEERCRLAMLCLPLNMRRLLAHAYFSKVWTPVAFWSLPIPSIPSGPFSSPLVPSDPRSGVEPGRLRAAAAARPPARARGRDRAAQAHARAQRREAHARRRGHAQGGGARSHR